MALDDHQETRLIRIEIDELADTTLEETIGLWWERFSGDENQRLRTKIEALKYARAKVKKLVDTTIGPDKVLASQRFKHLSEMLEEEQAALKEAVSSGYTTQSITPTGRKNFTVEEDWSLPKLGTIRS